MKERECVRKEVRFRSIEFPDCIQSEWFLVLVRAGATYQQKDRGISPDTIHPYRQAP